MKKDQLLETILSYPEGTINRVVSQESHACPFCGTLYVKGEHRRIAVRCPVCSGKGKLAEEASDAMQEIMRDSDSLSIETITKIVGTIGSSFERAECRALLKQRINNS